MTSSTILSVGVCVPKQIRSNEYYLNHPSAEVQRLVELGVGKLWRKIPELSDPFTEEMEQYLGDPFRGSKERRMMLPGQTSILFEIQAAKNALEAAKMTPKDIDAMIVTSFLPDHVGAGNAAYIARELGTRCPAWNLESACSSGIVALENANALIRSGSYQNILIIQSCNYGQTVVDEDSTSWFVGDGCGALVVSKCNTENGFLGFHVESTNETCGIVSYRINRENLEQPALILENVKGAGKILQESSKPHLVSCCQSATQKAGVSLGQIDFAIFSTPTAWYANASARTLGLSVQRTISTHEKYGNIGPAMLPANLYEALSKNLIQPGSKTLLYQIGSVSNAAAAVLKVGNIHTKYSEI